MHFPCPQWLPSSILHPASWEWSWRRELNPRPADYKSAALPLSYASCWHFAELILYLASSRIWIGKSLSCEICYGKRCNSVCQIENFSTLPGAGYFRQSKKRCEYFGLRNLCFSDKGFPLHSPHLGPFF